LNWPLIKLRRSPLLLGACQVSVEGERVPVQVIEGEFAHNVYGDACTAAQLRWCNPFPSARHSKAKPYGKGWCTCSTQPGIRQRRAPMLGPLRSRGARSDGSSLCCSVTSRKPASCGARGDHGGTEGAAVSNRSTEDPLTMTCRHVREAEGHVARQEALIQELNRDGHIELAVEVRELLATLKTSLRLAQEHLSIELKAQSHKP